MGRRIGLGAFAGFMVAAICWRGNHTAGVVSIFPDGLTFAAIILLLRSANRLEQRLSPFESAWRVGLPIASAAAVVFGCGVVLVGLRNFSSPTPSVLVGNFVMACAATLGCGWIAALSLGPRQPSTDLTQ